MYPKGLLIDPPLVALKPTELIDTLGGWLLVVICLDVLVALLRVAVLNPLGAAQFLALAACGIATRRSDYNINHVMTLLVLSVMSATIDFLQLAAVAFADEEWQRKLSFGILKFHWTDVPDNFWALLFNFRCPLVITPIVIILSAVASGTSTVVSFSMYSEIQHNLDLHFVEEIHFQETWSSKVQKVNLQKETDISDPLSFSSVGHTLRF
jgi:hypothetical protein